LVPTEKPTNRLTSRLIRELVDPTAASAASPAQRPTTTTSAALNSSCSRLESISGRANNKIFPASGPCTISIRYPARSGFCVAIRFPSLIQAYFEAQ
jgi:hypothetical protein